MCILGFDDRELKNWYRKIDTFYSALISSLDQYLNLKSNEQVLKLRIDFKEKAEYRKKIFSLNKFNGVSFLFVLMV